jgi:wyosine [tRNA(Phe)-imidazoG37] synthetase (radical SAM superfamily)
LGKSYSTDGKVTHYSTEEDINEKLSRIIGERFRKYRERWDDVHANFLETEFPMFLQVHPNQNCNYKCPHCLLGQSNVKKAYKEPSMKFDLFKKIVDEGNEFNCPSISIQGWNEPLSMKKIFEYIKYAKDKDFIDIMLNSNGSLLDENKIKKILDSGLTRIRFSMDAATAATYKKVRLEDGFDKIKENITKLMELRDKGNYKLPIVGVSFCEIITNTHEKDLFAESWSNIVDFVSIQTFIPPVHNEVYNKYYTESQNTNDNIPSLFKCPQPFERVDIHDNMVFPCCYYSSKELKIGDLNKGTIYEAWNSDKAKYIRSVCRSGEYYKIYECDRCVKSTFGKLSFDQNEVDPKSRTVSLMS